LEVIARKALIQLKNIHANILILMSDSYKNNMAFH